MRKNSGALLDVERGFRTLAIFSGSPEGRLPLVGEKFLGIICTSLLGNHDRRGKLTTNENSLGWILELLVQ
jgi:hypothetical protein